VNEKPPSLAASMWKRFAAAAAVIIAFSAAATATAGLLQVDELGQAIRFKGSTIKGVDQEITRAEAGDPRTILLLGSDARWLDKQTGAPARSDTMMLVRLDPDKEATALLSIPRDLKVEIPGRGTAKMNEAYSLGGPKLVIKTLKQMLGIKINHVLNVRFGAFSRAINRLGCVYVDVDQRYFNDNSGIGPDYATIDLQPGYQRLCGQDSLDYVRYRHTDSDLVRAARQQDFLRQVKQQIRTGRLFNDRKELLKIVGRYTETDRELKRTKTLLSLLKLGLYSAGHPVREVHIKNLEDEGESGYLVASQRNIERAVREFMGVRSTAGPRADIKPTDQQKAASKKRKKRKPVANVPGLEQAAMIGENLAIPVATKIPFPVYYPTVRYNGSVYPKLGPRVYKIRDRGGKLHDAYRFWVQKGTVGEYYGMQGTDWKNPPILDGPTGERRCGGETGRKVQVYSDGQRWRLVAWRTKDAAYWVSNTLAQTLTKRQMLALACTAKKTR
jgi:polyisoprenyl-teichoic acid--peptidoglycan teichoic acid transferase